MNCAEPLICNPLDPSCVDHNAGVLACQTEQNSCQAQYDAYDAYLTNMGAGVSLHNLPQLFKDILGPHYPSANLSQVRFGYINQQPPNNATTDCDKIYFNSASYVNDLADGTLDEDFGWLLHELRHFEQCGQVGGRDDYAKMWWDNLSETQFSSLIQSGSWDVVHDQMQMEQDADNRRDAVWPQLQACCIHPSTNRLIRPLQVSSMSISPQAPKEGNVVTFNINASDGAEPLLYEWSVKGPTSGFFTTLASSRTASFTPSVIGTWQVRVQVLQANGSSGNLDNDYEETQSFTVEPYVPIISNLTLSTSNIDINETIQGTVQVDQIASGATVNVALSSSSSLVTVPASVAVTGGAGHNGSQTFAISAGLVPPHTATLTASVGGSTKSVTLKVNGPTVDRVEVSLSDLYANEWFDVRLKLDRPPPVSITVALESSNARLVQVPRQVTFRRGEQEKTLRVQAGSDVRRASTVTLRARMDNDRERVVETRVRVQPGSRGTRGGSD